MWDYETLGIREDDEVHEALKDAILFNGKRYEVSLPWKEAHGPLPSNYQTSRKRLKGQLERLRSDSEILDTYDAIIKEQEEAGIIERVAELETADKIHYLPHHAVVRKDAKTTKVRVVYDASSKEGKGGVSLNDCLHVGPALSPLLFDILIRFREKRVALVGDIEKEFLNIVVNERDRDCLRFLWVKSVDSEQLDPVVYRFCRVVFGVNCSPFLLNATLQYHLDSFTEIDPEFVRIMKKSFYVDDLVTGQKTTQEAGELYGKAKTRLAIGGFKLRKWLTNSEVLRAKITQRELRGESNVDKQIESADESYAKATLGAKVGTKNEKVLGQSWNCASDTFVFELSEMVEKADGLPATKRNILKVIAGMYDPLGLLSPVLVSMKVLFQELCVSKVDWDERITSESEKSWIGWLKDLKETKEIHVPRCVYGIGQGEENPADIGSRGERASKLKESELWWRGPTWLTRPESEWPSSEVSETPQRVQSNEERKKVNVTVASVTKRTGVTQVIDVNKFSNFGRL
ncbi:hypothetical protein ACROYT_G037353 [Oculina patagonica]